MGRVGSWIGKGLGLAGTLLLIVVSLPLLALLVLILRPVLIVVAVVGLAAALVLAICSQRFREWFETLGQQQIPYIRYQGLRFAPEIAVHPRHSWVRINGQRADIGVDDLVQSTLGPVEKVELPRVGTWCCQDDPLFTLRRGDRVLHVRSPISGTVEAINRALLDLPDLVNQTPFTRGWAVRMRAEPTEQECAGLLRGKQAHEWFRGEVDRLIGGLMSCEAIGPALPDGGELAGDLHTHISDRAWRALVRDFFDTPSVLIRPVDAAPSHPL